MTIRCELLCVLAIGALGSAGIAAADEARVITVNGSAEMSLAPDQATVRMSASAMSQDIDSARRDVVQATRRFLELADDLGVDDDEVSTTGLNIQPQYRWDRENNQQVHTGYRVARQIVVKIDDIEQLGPIMEGAVDAGINHVQPPQLERSDAHELRRQLLARAARDARANALAIAAALDAELGGLYSLNAAQGGGYRPELAAMREAAFSTRAADASGAETYSLGEITLSTQVTAQFEIAAE